jgi:YVTN family beta-propeller protein
MLPYNSRLCIIALATIFALIIFFTIFYSNFGVAKINKQQSEVPVYNESAIPWTGMKVYTLTPQLSRALGLTFDRGLIVSTIEKGSPSEKVGMHGATQYVSINGTKIPEGGDIILGLDNQSIIDRDNFSRYVMHKKIGEPLQLTLWRDDRKHNVTIFVEADPVNRYEYADIYKKPSSITFTSFVNFNIDASLQYPSTWNVDSTSNPEEVDFKSNYENSNDTYHEHVRIRSIESQGPIPSAENAAFRTLRNICIHESSRSESDQNLSNRNSNSIMITPHPDCERIYSDGPFPGLKVFEMYLNTTAKYYIIQYFAKKNDFDKFFPTVKKMIETFKTSEIKKFRDFDAGIRMDYPKDWTVSKYPEYYSGQNITFTTEGNYHNDSTKQLEILVNDLLIPTDLNELVTTTKNDINSDPNFEAVHLREIKSDFHNLSPSQVICYSYFDDHLGGRINKTAILSVQNSRSYYISYFSGKDDCSEVSYAVAATIDSIGLFETLSYDNLDLRLFLTYPDTLSKFQNDTDHYVIFYPQINEFGSNVQTSVLAQMKALYSVKSPNGCVDKWVDCEHIFQSKLSTIKSNLTDFSQIGNLNLTFFNNSNSKFWTYPVVYDYFSHGDYFTNIWLPTIYSESSNKFKYYDILFILPKRESIDFKSMVMDVVSSIKTFETKLLDSYEYSNLNDSRVPFSITYPKNWKPSIEKSPFSTITFCPEGCNNNSRISVAYLSRKDTSIPTLISNDFHYVNSTFKIKSRNTESFHNKDFNGDIIEYTYPSYPFSSNADHDTKSKIYYLTHKNSDKYVIWYTAEYPKNYHKYLQVVQKMIESLKVQKEVQLKEPTGFNIGNQSKPTGITVDEDNNLLFVVNSGTDRLSVVNGSSNVVITRINVGEGPFDLTFNPVTDKIYVTNLISKDISVIKRENNGWVNGKSIHVGGQPMDIVADSVNNRVYVADPSTGNMTVIDGDEDKVVANVSITNMTAERGIGIAFDDLTNRIYVANPNTHNVTVIDASTAQKIANISSVYGNDFKPIDITLDPISNRGYVADSSLNSLFVIDLATNTITYEIPVGFSPNNVAVNPTNHLIYVTNTLSNSLSVINPVSLKNIPVETDNTPFGVAVNSRTNVVYVTNQGDNTISLINGTTSDHPQQIYDAKFDIRPSEGGSIICDGKQIDIARLYAYSNSSDCIPIANGGFEFSSWSQAIGPNETRTVVANDHKDFFKSIISFLSPNKGTTLKISKNAQFTVNFTKTQEVKIPNEIWLALFGIIASILIPTSLKWIYGTLKRRKQRNKLEDWRTKIQGLYKNNTITAKSRLSTLSDFELKIAKDLSMNEIASVDSDFLNSLISHYRGNLEKQ